MTNFESERKPKILLFKNNIFLSAVLIFICIVIFLVFSLYSLIQPPRQFPNNATLEIESGMSMSDIANEARKTNIISSDLALYIVMTYWHDPTTIHAGRYVFEEPATLFEVAQKLARSEVDLSLIPITIPEGVPVAKIAEIAEKKLVKFDIEYFLGQSSELEGYLFPETYFVPEEFTADDLILLLKDTYEEKILPLRKLIDQSEFSEYEILILASIIEREANNEESMKLISGILQNRMSIGMALQADASIEYVLDKPLSELTSEDLKIDSPYNTYLYTGLPPTPIGNPGLQAIMAVLEPTESDYFYYITDEDGVFHYAQTFNQHKSNIAKYLR